MKTAEQGGEASLLGSNVPTVGGCQEGFRYAREWNCECIQIYVSLSRRWNIPDLSEEEVSRFQSAWKESSVLQVVAHVPFLVNLASPDNEMWQKSINRLVVEISRCNRLGVPFLVLHPGSYGTSCADVGMKRIIEALNVVCDRIGTLPVKILLETTAGQGTVLGSRFEELAYILESVKRPELFGLCLDTEHIFMAGYDVRGYREYENVLKKFDAIIGLEKIQVIHLNDSKSKLGSRFDRHACIGEGELGLPFFHIILTDPRFLNTPKILEIPDRDERSKDNLELLRKIIANSNSILANDEKSNVRENTEQNGIFITFEGIHGSGKSTIISMLCERLKAMGLDTITLVDQQGTTVSRKIRQINLKYDVDPITEAFLIASARRQNVEKVIKPNIQTRKIILCERFNDALFAFQGAGRGLPSDLLECIASAVQDDLQPDLTILLDIDPPIALSRISSKLNHRIEREPVSFHEKVRQGYLELAKQHPERIKVLKADLAPHFVFENAWKEIEKIIENRVEKELLSRVPTI